MTELTSLENYLFLDGSYYCAVLDLLGTKDFVKKDYEKARDMYLQFCILAKDYLQSTKELGAELKCLEIDPNDFYYSIFSDSLLLTSNDMPFLIQEIRYFMRHFMLIEKGYYIRGGLSHGCHYENVSRQNHFLISQAHIKAVELEQTASWPRCIIDNDILKTGEFNYLADGSIFQCEDNLWSINPFLGIDPEELRLILGKLKSRCVEFQESSKIYEKYMFLIQLMHEWQQSCSFLKTHITDKNEFQKQIRKFIFLECQESANGFYPQIEKSFEENMKSLLG